MENKMKRCPYCGEEIPVEAHKCRYCGEWLDGTHGSVNTMFTSGASEQQDSTHSQQTSESVQSEVPNVKQTPDETSAIEDVAADVETVQANKAGKTLEESSSDGQPPLSDPAPTSFVDAIKRCYQKLAIFEGRATRKEFWFFFLFANLLVIAITAILAGIDNYLLYSNPELEVNVTPVIGIVFLILFMIGVLIPYLSVSVRRLHDIGKSGWYWFLQFIPIIGQLLILYFWWQESDDDNKYGTDPAFHSADTVQKHRLSKKDKIITTIVGGIIPLVLILQMVFLVFYKALGLDSTSDSHSENTTSIIEDSMYNNTTTLPTEDMVLPGTYEGLIDGAGVSLYISAPDAENKCTGTYENIATSTTVELTGEYNSNGSVSLTGGYEDSYNLNVSNSSSEANTIDVEGVIFGEDIHTYLTKFEE